MQEQPRVLIIEDDELACETYAGTLTENGYLVDTASNLGVALDHLSRKTYHVALVDIGLGGASDVRDANVDGLEILDFLRSQNEGTAALIVSGKPDTQLAADTLQKYKAARYVAKRSITLGGISKLLEEVEKAKASSKINLYGEEDNILGLLAGKTGEDIWVSECLNRLRPAESYTGLKHFMEGFFEPLLPLLLLKSKDTFMEFERDTKLLHGNLWSKAIAKSLEVFVIPDSDDCKDLAESVGLSWKSENILNKYKKARLVGYVCQNNSYVRSDFVGGAPSK